MTEKVLLCYVENKFETVNRKERNDGLAIAVKSNIQGIALNSFASPLYRTHHVSSYVKSFAVCVQRSEISLGYL